MNEDTDPFGPYRCQCCGAMLVGWDDDRAQGRRSYALLRFDDGQTWRESAAEVPAIVCGAKERWSSGFNRQGFTG